MPLLTTTRNRKLEFLAERRRLWESCLPLDHPSLLLLAGMMRRAGLYSAATKDSDIATALPRLLRKAAAGQVCGIIYNTAESHTATATAKRGTVAELWAEVASLRDEMQQVRAWVQQEQKSRTATLGFCPPRPGDSVGNGPAA